MFANILKAFSFKFLSSLAGFYIVYIITSELSIGSAGKYFLFLAIVTALGNIGRLGFDYRAIRLTTFLNRGKDVRNESWKIINTIIKFYLIALVVIIISNSFFDINISFVVAACFMSLTMIIGFMYQGLGKITIMQLYHGVLFNALFILFYGVSRLNEIEFSQGYMKLMFIISWGIVLLIALITWSKKYKAVYDFEQLSIPKDIVTNKNVLSNNILMMTSQWGIPICLGLMISGPEIAVYMVALKISTFLALLVLILSSVMSPKLAVCIRAKNYKMVKKLFLVSFIIVVLMCMPYILLVVFFPAEILAFFGKGYDTYNGILVLWVLSVGQFIYALSGVISMFLNLSGNEGDVLKANIWSVVCLVLVGVVLVYKFGVFGAAISQSIALSVMVVSSFYYTHCRLKGYKR
jgi:O-antigen/teichoic acid export membrane protein